MERFELRHTYQGLKSVYGITTIADSTAREIMVVVTEIPENKGKSVTNAYDAVATELYYDRLSHIPVEDIRWIEHYTKEEIGLSEATFDEVFLDWTGKEFTFPKWKPLDKETLEKIRDI